MLTTNKLIAMHIGTSGPQGKGMQRSTSRVMWSKVKVTGGRSYIWRPGGGIILDQLSPVDRGVQSAMQMLPLKRERGVAHCFNCPPNGGYASCWRTCLLFVGLLRLPFDVFCMLQWTSYICGSFILCLF